jgi:hypothetical protein
MHLSGERGIRTPKSLRTPVFKTGAIAVLPALLVKTTQIRHSVLPILTNFFHYGNQFGNHSPPVILKPLSGLSCKYTKALLKSQSAFHHPFKDCIVMRVPLSAMTHSSIKVSHILTLRERSKRACFKTIPSFKQEHFFCSHETFSAQSAEINTTRQVPGIPA